MSFHQETLAVENHLHWLQKDRRHLWMSCCSLHVRMMTIKQLTCPQFILHPFWLHWWNDNYTHMKNQYTTSSCTKNHSHQMLVLANARQSLCEFDTCWCVLPGPNDRYKCIYCEIIWVLHKLLSESCINYCEIIWVLHKCNYCEITWN